MDSQNLRKGLQGKADQRLACGFPRRGIFRDFSRLGSILRLRIFVGWETMIGSQAQIRGAWSRRPRYGRSGEAPGRLHASSPSSRSMTRRDSTHDRPATPGMDMTGWAPPEAMRPRLWARNNGPRGCPSTGQRHPCRRHLPGRGGHAPGGTNDVGTNDLNMRFSHGKDRILLVVDGLLSWSGPVAQRPHGMAANALSIITQNPTGSRPQRLPTEPRTPNPEFASES